MGEFLLQLVTEPSAPGAHRTRVICLARAVFLGAPNS